MPETRGVRIFYPLRSLPLFKGLLDISVSYQFARPHIEIENSLYIFFAVPLQLIDRERASILGLNIKLAARIYNLTGGCNSSYIHRCFFQGELNDLMESKGGKKKSSSSKSLFYEAPLGYSIEDVRPHGGIKKFRSAAYSNCVRKPS
ncbi:hypothetical protein Salat_2165900 [Sesamum alatum]|uniref:Uncharacterized protein n=1 Tax=Sesamum alatum TaxID=300844 RepID=A0AAE1XT81_9LAMI|nr:hypothetical protein Salat_2165900 [Sesamum alatum]